MICNINICVYKKKQDFCLAYPVSVTARTAEVILRICRAYCILYKSNIVEIWYNNVYYYVICLYSNDSESINHYCALNEKCPSCYRFVSNVTKMSFVLLGNKSVLSHVLVAIDDHE